LAVYRGIARLTNPGAFRTWLYQTTRHRAIDVLRKRKRESELLTPMPIEAAEVSRDESDLTFEAADRQSLDRGMARLSDLHREALVLRYWGEMSYANIALITGCSVGTVRSRLFHAKRGLRGALDQEEAKRERKRTGT
jgi:RNA polymerase sigma-70 factor (ECF subfamily)